jgi:hypothetical protein
MRGVKAGKACADRIWVKTGLLLFVAAAALAFAASASALIEPGNISALRSNPYSAQPGVTVNGMLETNQPPGPGGTPQDYLKFTVANAGETIEFSDQNTSTGLNAHSCDYAFNGCPVYLSVVDQSFKDPGASVGTYAIYGDTEVFDWTAPAPGTYYMVLESDGDVNVTYAASYTVVSGGTGGCQQNCGPAPVTPPLVRKLRVFPKQSGATVNVDVTPGQSLRTARVMLLDGNHLIAAQTRGALGTTRYRFTLHLTAAYKQRLKAHHKLHLVVRIVASATSGATVTYNRAVTLT